MRSPERTKIIGVLAAVTVAVCLLALMWKLPSGSSQPLDTSSLDERARVPAVPAPATSDALQHEELTESSHVEAAASAETRPAPTAPRTTISDASAKITLQGIVRDARTVRPIAGASLTLH